MVQAATRRAAVPEAGWKNTSLFSLKRPFSAVFCTKKQKSGIFYLTSENLWYIFIVRVRGSAGGANQMGKRPDANEPRRHCNGQTGISVYL